jgi:hypothetical protein
MQDPPVLGKILGKEAVKKESAAGVKQPPPADI